MSTVIKANGVGSVLRRLSTVDLADHLALADAHIDRAKRDATEIVADARRRSVELFEQTKKNAQKEGYDKGFAEGTTAGYEQAHQESIERFHNEHEAVVNDLMRAIEDIDRIKGDLAIAAKRDLLEFAVSIARRLTFDIGRLNRESAAANLERSLKQVAMKTDLTVRVHPDDFESMQQVAPQLIASMAKATAISIESDESISPGGCITQTDRSAVDATLETQVKQMVALLLGEDTDDG